MPRILAATLTLIALALPFSAAAEKKKDAGLRGPEHRVLETLVGTWDAKVTFYFPDPAKPSVSKGVMTRSMILAGNYLQESFDGEFLGKKFSGLALIGFDPNKKKFVTVWADSMSTNMVTTEGTYDPLQKTLTSLGRELDPTTKKDMKMRDVLKIVSADEQVLEMYRQPKGEPKEFKLMEVVYTRKK
jgi:hypothetical protein